MPKLPESATLALDFSFGLGLSAALRSADEARIAPRRMASFTAFTLVPPNSFSAIFQSPPRSAPPVCSASAREAAHDGNRPGARQTAQRTFPAPAPEDE